MAVGSRDRTTEKPVAAKQVTPIADRIPLSEVEFTVPQAIDGVEERVRVMVAGVPRIDTSKVAPLTYDPALGLVVIGKNMYPLSAVLRMRRKH